MTSLLTQYCPTILYDSHEQWFASPVTVLTSQARLLRANGTTITKAPSPGFLGPDYPNGETALATDYLRQDRSTEEFARTPRPPATVYGRVEGSWLQYWMLYFYDDPGLLGAGDHQADIEMVQLQVNDAKDCVAFAYSQHRSGVRGAANQLEWTPGHSPITYPARGSHANHPHAGTSVSDRSFLPDRNDGQGPRVFPELVVLDSSASWTRWPGSWGATKPGDPTLGQVGIEASSPHSFPSHLAWRNPQRFHDSCDAA